MNFGSVWVMELWVVFVSFSFALLYFPDIRECIGAALKQRTKNYFHGTKGKVFVL